MIAAIFVVIVPEGLPMSISLALSSAAKAMLKDKMLVRRNKALETLGNID